MLGTVAAFGAALLVYLALAPLKVRRLQRRSGLLGFVLLAALAVYFSGWWLGQAESVYFVLMVLMIAWSVLPFLTSLAGRNR